MSVTEAMSSSVGAERLEPSEREDILRRAADFDALVREHREAVYRIAARMTRRHEDADDLVQETFLRAYQSLGQFRGDSTASTWLYRIVTNLALNHLRRRARFQRFATLFRRETDAVSQEPVDADETKRAVRVALDSLPASQRAVVVLFDMEGLSAAEISGILDVPEGTVRSRLHHARRHLRKRLSRYAFGVPEELDNASRVS